MTWQCFRDYNPDFSRIRLFKASIFISQEIHLVVFECLCQYKWIIPHTIYKKNALQNTFSFAFQCDAQVYDVQIKQRGLTARRPYGCVAGYMVGLQIDHHWLCAAAVFPTRPLQEGSLWFGERCNIKLQSCSVMWITHRSVHIRQRFASYVMQKKWKKTSMGAGIMHSRSNKDALCRKHIFNFIQQQNAMYNLNQRPW